MSDPVYAPIKVANPKETRQDWNIVTRDLSELALWIARTFAIDVSDILNRSTPVYSGSQEPVGSDKGKIWIKTSSPPAIGIPFSDGYQLIYPMPPNTPQLWMGGKGEHPNYTRLVTSEELDELGLTAPQNENYYYIVLEP